MKQTAALTVAAAIFAAVLFSSCAARTEAVHPKLYRIAVSSSGKEEIRDSAIKMCGDISDISSGKLAAQIELCDDPVAALENGQAELALADNECLSRKIPSVSMFTKPFYFRSSDDMELALCSKETTDLLEKQLDRIEILGAIKGENWCFISKAPIAYNDDFKDIRIACEDDDASCAIYNACGAEPVRFDSGKRVEALKKREVDAVELRIDEALSMGGYPKGYYISDMEHRIEPVWFLRDLKTEYTKEETAVIAEAAARFQAEMLKRNEEDRKKLPAEYGEELDTVDYYYNKVLYEISQDVLFSLAEDFGYDVQLYAAVTDAAG